MQETNLSFQGINLNTPADTCPDGQLQTCIGLEMHNGALRPSLLQGTEYTIIPPVDVQLTLLHRHSTNSYDNFIFLGSDDLLYASPEQDEMVPESFSVIRLQPDSVRSLGNVIVVQTSQGPYYYLYKDDEYKFIGQKPPEINMSFGLYGNEVIHYTTEEKSFKVSRWTGGYTILDTSTSYDTAFGVINTLLEQYKKLIFYPFFIRAAYRLVDGTHSMFTSPVLLIPDTRGPRAFLSDAVVEEVNDNGTITITVKGKPAAHAIGTYIRLRINSTEGLERWKDIIAGVDVFMSIPTNPIDVEKEIKEFSSPDSMPPSWGQYGSGNVYDEHNFPYKSGGGYFLLPQKENFQEELLASSQFYLVKSWTLDAYLESVSNEPQQMELDIPKENLPFAESLSETHDYRTHDTIIAKGSFVYNTRMHLFGLSRMPFSGFLPENMWPYLSGENQAYTIDVHLKQSDGQSLVVRSQSSENWIKPLSRFYYYPDQSATRMVVYSSDGHPVLDLPLSPHPFLNGAYYLAIWQLPVPATDLSDMKPLSETIIKESNKFMVSSAGNPFSYPLSGIYTVGNAPIVGLSSIVTPLSQGQFGAFDLMIFTEEGNYAASVSSEGTYSTNKPMQRDVCINPSAIVPTDYTILYISHRGLMSANGNTIESLSDVLDGPSGEDGIPDFMQGLKSYTVSYDYVGQRIILFTEGSPYAFVRSAEGMWTMAAWGEVSAVLNVYPYAYIQRGTSLVRLDKPYDTSLLDEHEAYLVTRPLKFGTLQLKSIHQLIVQGLLGEVKELSLYVSRDTVNWIRISTHKISHIRSRRGTPYKYWRISFKIKINASQYLSGIRFHVIHRNEIRFS